MSEITDYADLLVDAHQTDDLDQVPNRDADKLRAMFLTPEHHDFGDLSVIASDDTKAFEYLRKVIVAWGDMVEASARPDKMATEVTVYREACSDFAQHFVMLGLCLARREAREALQEAYDRQHPESDGIAEEDNRARVADWKATA